MVSQKYRWDFIGLSTDEKPTSETSDKVVNGSTYYCSDTSKLYVYCDGTWYERKPLGGGGGGGTSDFNDLSNRPKYNGSDMTGSTNIPEVVTYSDFTGTDGTTAGTAGLVPAPATTDAGKFLKADGTWDTAGGSSYTAGDGIDITNDIISATNTGKARVLTEADYNWPTTNPDGVAMWKLTTGFYSVATGTKIYVTTSNSSTSSYKGLFLLHSNGYQCSYLMIKGVDGSMRYWNMNIGAATVREQFYITQTVDNLTSSSEYSPLSANQGKVLKNLVDSLAIRASGTPTTSTVGSVGTLYEDTTNGKLYICTDTTGGTYTWEEVGAGGGGGPTVVQTTGTSTTDVMSQNAVTSMVFGSSTSRVKIGNSATSTSDNTIAIGDSASASASEAMALGQTARASHTGSVALGASTRTSVTGEIAIGVTSTAYGYNRSNYRIISGVYDPQSAHDAANKEYVDPTTDSSAPTTATVGRLGQIYIDTTTATAYMCVAADTATPSYTWKQITA